MRWRRLVRTVLVYALLGAVATVASSWAIHAAHAWRVAPHDAQGVTIAASRSPHFAKPTWRRYAVRFRGLDTSLASNVMFVGHGARSGFGWHAQAEQMMSWPNAPSDTPIVFEA